MTIQFSPIQGFRYPDPNEFLKDVPQFIENLARDVEKRVVMIFTSQSDRSAKLTSPVSGQLTWRQDTQILEVFDGSSYQQIYPAIPNITSGTAAPSGTGNAGDIYVQYAS
jgi:hypothetical protein